MAAIVSVSESVKEPIECAEINTIGALVLLEEAALASVRKLVSAVRPQ
jgi:UDP-glucose 4-epimerase